MAYKRKYIDRFDEKKKTQKTSDKKLVVSDIKALDCKMPRFRKSQRVFVETGSFFLDKDNTIIVKHNILNDDEIETYLTGALNVERVSTFSGFAMKPRYEICYTKLGEPYTYSNISQPTVIYPDYVKNLIPSFIEIVEENLGKDTPYKELSNGVDILYGPDFPRGGSISAHSDDELDWGLVIIFSLGQTRWFRIKHKETKEYYNIKMPHNSLICMHGKTFQKLYTHQVDKLSKNEQVGYRLSLNLRFLKSK